MSRWVGSSHEIPIIIEQKTENIIMDARLIFLIILFSKALRVFPKLLLEK